MNDELWLKVEKTNPKHTKEVNFGRKITAIDPYQQIKNATKEFGPVGKGWGWEVKQVQHLPTNEVCILISMWHGDSGKVFEQWGQASLYIDKAEAKKDTDCMKKATTDGITKCLSLLGFNADIFLGKYEDNKYVQQMKSEFAEPLYTKEQRDTFMALKSEIDAGGFYLFIRSISEEAYISLYNSFEKDIGKNKEACKALEKTGLEEVQEIIMDIAQGIDDNDPACIENLQGWAAYEKKVIWSMLSKEQQEALTKFKEQADG